MTHEKTIATVVVIAIVVFIIIWSLNKRNGPYQSDGEVIKQDAQKTKENISAEYARLVGAAANAGRNLRQDLNMGNPVATQEGYVTFQQEADNADTYDLRPVHPDFVGAIDSQGGRNVPAALAGMTDAEIAKALADMDRGRTFEDPRGQLPDMPLTSNPFGYDIASPNNYKPVNTFGANYKLKGRNFEINLRGSIPPGEVWQGMYKPRGASRTLMGGGLLETPVNEERRIEFERARSRQVIRNGQSAEVIY